MSGKLTIEARGLAANSWCQRAKPSNFLSEPELRGKFAGLTDAVIGVERADALASAVLAIDQTSDVSSLMRLAAPLMSARLAGE